MKLLTAAQIKEADAYTVEHEPISGLALMERATSALAEVLAGRFADKETPFIILAGPGNNGGDAITLARFLPQLGYADVRLVLCGGGPKADDAQASLAKYRYAKPASWTEASHFEAPPPGAVVVDGLFGVGLSRPLEGFWAELVQWINGLGHCTVAIDGPSGLQAEAQQQQGPVVKADLTVTFHAPKHSFLFTETGGPVGQLAVVDIGLHRHYTESAESSYHFFDLEQARSTYRPRRGFGHKGTFGRAQLVAGSTGSMGAALLAGQATLRAGAGLLHLQIPLAGLTIAQTALPEAQCLVQGEDCATELVEKSGVTALAIGPGLGVQLESLHALRQVMGAKLPRVIDADGLNLLAKDKSLLSKLDNHCLLTPHHRELERLVGHTLATSHEALAAARQLCQERGCHMVLKGAFSRVVDPAGQVSFNGSGNVGMATGGSGDVLTGVLLGLLAQGYAVGEAAKLGTWLHGRAGDHAALALGYEALLASDVVKHLGAAFQEIYPEGKVVI